MFKCDRCGLCCMNLKSSPIYADLDRGDGICKFLDMNSELCSIYSKRPLKCNVDKVYELYFKNSYTLDQYYQMNYEACTKLKKRGQ